MMMGVNYPGKLKMFGSRKDHLMVCNTGKIITGFSGSRKK
jgi:hypothetical protein